MPLFQFTESRERRQRALRGTLRDNIQDEDHEGQHHHQDSMYMHKGCARVPTTLCKHSKIHRSEAEWQMKKSSRNPCQPSKIRDCSFQCERVCTQSHVETATPCAVRCWSTAWLHFHQDCWHFQEVMQLHMFTLFLGVLCLTFILTYYACFVCSFTLNATQHTIQQTATHACPFATPRPPGYLPVLVMFLELSPTELRSCGPISYTS